MTTANPSLSRINSLSFMLTAAGFLIALAAALDFITLLLDPTPSSVDWRLNTLTQLVDRGVVPLLGFSLILLGGWLRIVTEGTSRKRSVGALTIAVFISCGLLGVIYLGIAPFHFRDCGIASNNAVTQLTRQVEQAEQQLDARLNQEITAISGLVSNESQIQQLKKSGGNLTEAQQQQVNQLLAQVEEFKKDPTALEARAEQSREQFLSRIRLQKEELQAEIEQNFGKSSIRIPLSSLLLSIGYLFIAINGVQAMNQ